MSSRAAAVLGLMVALAGCAIGDKTAQAEQLFDRGRRQEEAGEIAAALRSYQEAIRVQPEYTEPHRRRAILLAARGEGERLRREYRAWLDQRPGSPVFHYLYGRLLDDSASQLAEFDRAIALDPTYYWGHYGRAYLLAKEGEIKKAIAAFESARDIRPTNPQPHLFLGYLYSLERKEDAAIESYRHAVRLDPDLSVGYRQLAPLYIGRGEFSLAIEAFRHAAELDGQDAQSRFYLGNLLKETGDLDGAITALEAAVEIQPGFADAWRNLGVIHHERGELERATTAYERAVDVDPNSSVVAYLLGIARLRQGKYDSAVAAFQRVIWIEPRQGRAHYFLGEIARHRKDHHQALAAYERAEAFLPPHPEVYYRLGRAYAAVGKYAEAASALSLSIQLLESTTKGSAHSGRSDKKSGLDLDIPPPPDVATVYRVLGEVYERQGKRQRAMAAYNRYLELSPDGEYADSIRSRLELLKSTL